MFLDYYLNGAFRSQVFANGANGNNTWRHYVYTMSYSATNTGTMRVYVNGLLDSTTSSSYFPNPSSTFNFYLGTNFQTYLSGNVDQIIIQNNVIDAANALRIYNKSLNLVETDSTNIETGELVVGGSVGIYRNLNVGRNLNIMRDASLNSKLFVNGDVSMNSKLFVNGDVSMNSKLSVLSDVSFNGNLFVGGKINNALLDASLNAIMSSVAPSFTGTVISAGDVSMNRSLFANGDVSLNSRLFVKNIATFDNDVSFNMDIFVGLDASLNSKLFVRGDVSMNSRLSVLSDVSFSSKLFVGTTLATNTIEPSNDGTTFNIGALQTSGTLNIGTRADRSGAINIGNGASASKTISIGGALTTTNIGGTLNAGNIVASGTVQAGSNAKLFTTGNDTVLQNNGVGWLYINCGTTGNGNAGVTVDSGGNVGIKGSPSASFALNVTGNVQAVKFSASSDYRIKENVKPLDGTFTVDVLKPVSYNNVLSKAPDVGFIAHEVQEFYPYLVSGDKDGKDMQSLNYIGLIGILTKEIQDLKKRVTELENKK